MRPTPTCGESISKRAIAAWLLLFVVASAAAVWADEFVLEVIPLQHRPAAEILPILQPFVVNGGVIKAADGQLIVRTTAANLAELRRLIAQLDRPPRRLMITVKQLSGDTARGSGAAVEGRLGERSAIDARVRQTEKRNDADRMQQVQAIEGGQAFIDVGRLIPITDVAVEQGRSGTRIEQQTRYADAATGFYARPRLDGDTVTIEISPYQTVAKGSTAPPAFDAQSLHTTVTGKLGEWIAIGASTADTEENSSGIVYSTGRRGEQDRQILLRVTLMP